MTKPVPIEAAHAARDYQRQLDPDGVEVGVSRQAVDELVEFALQFEPQPLPGMMLTIIESRPPDAEPGDEPVATLEVPAMAGELNEIRLVDEGLDAMRFDLIRLNGRTYAPEVIEAEDGPCAHEAWSENCGSRTCVDCGERLITVDLSEAEPENPLEPEEIGICVGCAKPLRVGEVVTPYDDEVGHANCDDPFSLDVSPELIADPEIPPAMVLIGRPARYAPLGSVAWAIKQSSSLHVAGNGQELTLADVDEVLARLAGFDGEEVGSATVLSDTERLIRFLVDVVIAERDAEIADLRTSVIAFAGPFAAEYARDRNWPAGHMAAHHFDILERAGARMVDFVRHVEPGAVA